MKSVNANVYSKMSEIPISNIHPEGWMKDFLIRQKNGLTGNLDKIGFPFNEISWGAPEIDTTGKNVNPGWWVYEQTAYHLDGIERCGALLNDEELLAKAKKSFDYVLANADTDGYLGPKFMRVLNGWRRWPHVVFFRALFAEYSRTGDKDILEAICRHYIECNSDHSIKRDALNIEIMLLAYFYSGKKELLDMAIKTYADYNEKCDDEHCAKAMLSDKPVYGHGVSHNEFCKLGALLYIATGDEEYIKPVLNAYDKIDKHQMLPDGLHCSNEFLLDNDHMQTHETCNVVDYTWTIGYILMATGDGAWADKIEKCIFNAGFGSVDDNFKSLQYFSGLNQVIATANSNHGDFFKGHNWLSYRPIPDTECCPGNVNRFMPNYCARMWMQKDSALFAVLYGPSTAEFDINGNKISIKQETKYPFGDDVMFTVEAESDLEFALNLRIPAWCEKAKILINGEEIGFTTEKGFVKLAREFKNGDVIILSLLSEIKVCDHSGGGTYVQKGAILYSLPVEAEEHLITNEKKTTEDFPAFDLYPAGDWNYSICPDEEMIFEDKASRTDSPWTETDCPFSITVSAKKIKGWELERTNTVYFVDNLYEVPWKRKYLKGDFAFTPRIPDEKYILDNASEETERIKLVPMGATRLRLTLFPKYSK